MQIMRGVSAVAKILSEENPKDRIGTDALRQLADRVLVLVRREGPRGDRVFSEADIEILRQHRRAWRARMGLRRWPPRRTKRAKTAQNKGAALKREQQLPDNSTERP